MLTKKQNGVANGPRLTKALAGVVGGSMDRRTFLKRSGLAAGGAAIASTLPLGNVQTAKAAVSYPAGIKTVKTVCTHCAVGCTVIAEVLDGVWIGQEPGWDSPLNLEPTAAKAPACGISPTATAGSSTP